MADARSWIPIRDDSPTPRRFPAPSANRHALAFALGLLAAIAFGSILLALPFSSRPGQPTAPIDALFTAVSATSVTGLAVVDTRTHWSPAGQVVVLALVQAGGLGFAVGANILLRMMRLGRGPSLEDQLLMKDGAPALSLREAQRLASRVAAYVLGVEALGAAALTAAFAREMPLPAAAWHGLFHSVNAFCNAGFDLQGGFRSLIPFGTSLPVNLTVMLLIQAGSIGFIVVDDLLRCRRWSRLPVDTRLVLVVNAALIVAGFAVFLATEWTAALAPYADRDKPLAALFQSVAARTAGYATIDWGAATETTLLLWLAVMLVGGASGSTAGGVKLSTAGVILATVQATLRGNAEPQAFRRRIAPAVVAQALTIVALFVAIHFLATVALSISEDLVGGRNVDMPQMMFEAMSGLATVGLSTGITPDLTAAGKLVLCIVMFVGRLGPLTAAFALQRRQRPQRFRLPDAPIRLG